jgi:predicted DsbA family dithiol-disulfide isomerase
MVAGGDSNAQAPGGERVVALTVDVISDVICPWCYIGKRRLEKAIALAGRQDVRVRWHPFRLNPQMPREGMSRRAYRTAKFGSWERSLALDAQVREAGRGEGIPFAFEEQERTPNTLDAHRLIWLAGREGIQDAVVEALFRAYFTEGRDVGERQTLLDAVAQAGLDRSLAAGILDGDGLDEISAEEERARRASVQSVPFFIINGEVAMSGAQQPGAFLDAFDRLSPSADDAGGECAAGPGDRPTC